MRYFFSILFLTACAGTVFAQGKNLSSNIMETSGVQTSNESSVPDDRDRFSRIAVLMDAGQRYANEGDYQEAEQAYLRALGKDPGNSKIQFQLSTLYIQTGQYKKAAELLKELLKLAPESSILLNNLAWIYVADSEMKNGELALRYAREALLTAPIAPDVWNTLAEAYHILGQYEPALRASEYAFELLRVTPGATEKQAQDFVQQYQKIKRAESSSKTLLNLDEGK